MGGKEPRAHYQQQRAASCATSAEKNPRVSSRYPLTTNQPSQEVSPERQRKEKGTPRRAAAKAARPPPRSSLSAMAFAAASTACKPSLLLNPRAPSRISSPRAQALLCRPSTSTRPASHGLGAPALAAPAPRRRAASAGIVCGKVSKGSAPPDFTLKDQDSKAVSLSKFKGKPVVVYFYPADETPGCTKQACAFRDSYEKFKKAGAEVIGISGDDAASHKAFAKKYRLPFTLLSDEGNRVRQAWGVPSDLFGTLPGRQTYVLDKKGVVQYIYNNQFQPEKHIGETLKILQSL